MPNKIKRTFKGYLKLILKDQIKIMFSYLLLNFLNRLRFFQKILFFQILFLLRICKYNLFLFYIVIPVHIPSSSPTFPFPPSIPQKGLGFPWGVRSDTSHQGKVFLPISRLNKVCHQRECAPRCQFKH